MTLPSRSFAAALLLLLPAIAEFNFTAAYGLQPALAAKPAVPATQPAADTIGRGSRVLVISIDGCRPDIALRANMPNLRSLISTGAFTMYARTTDVAITLPSHTSMITGVPPEKHNVTWNGDADEKTFHYPNYPTLMEIAHKAGYTTAIVAAKSKFVALARPGSIDWAGLPPTGQTTDAAQVAEEAKTIIETHKPQVMMLHFGDPDKVGHAIGWGTPEQIAALEKVDKGLGVVIAALKNAGVFDDTLIILSADHGGSGRGHGGLDPRSRFIPWVVHGPHVRQGYDLTRDSRLSVRTEDTFATAAAFLGLTTADDIDGHPVSEIWQRDELMTDAPRAKAHHMAPKKIPATQSSK